MKSAEQENSKLRSQSATEYLTTYGWMLLVIGIVLAALYGLGIFNLGTFMPAHCILQAGWSCIDYVMNTGGVLQLKLSQGIGSDVEITGVACYQNSNSITETKLASGILLHSGEQKTFLAQCYDSNGNAYSGTVGSPPYQGYLTIYFTRLSDGITETASGAVGIGPETSGTFSISTQSSLSVSVSPSSATIGNGQSITFTATASGGSGGDTYHWYVYGGVPPDADAVRVIACPTV